MRSDALSALRATGVSTIDLPREADSFALRRFDARWRYTLVGVLLALGAPLGALLLRILSGVPSLQAELSDHAFFYVYTLVGTSLVFGVVGFFAGRKADLVAGERDGFEFLAEHDDLTELLNQRAFWKRYRRAVEKANRYDEPLSLLLIDVDQLRHLNDQAGHRFGNRVLLHVAEAISESKRIDDSAARWGGDEFVILMSGADAEAAVRVADEILKKVARKPVTTSREERTVTVTIGSASRERGSVANGLFERADRALHLGKSRGGNRYQALPETAEDAR